MAILIIFIAILLIIIIFPSHDKSENDNKNLQLRGPNDSKLSRNHDANQYMEYGRTKNTKFVHGNNYEFNNCTFYIKNNVKSGYATRKKYLTFNKPHKHINDRNYTALNGFTDNIDNGLFKELNNRQYLSRSNDICFPKSKRNFKKGY